MTTCLVGTLRTQATILHVVMMYIEPI